MMEQTNFSSHVDLLRSLDAGALSSCNIRLLNTAPHVRSNSRRILRWLLTFS